MVYYEDIEKLGMGLMTGRKVEIEGWDAGHTSWFETATLDIEHITKGDGEGKFAVGQEVLVHPKGAQRNNADRIIGLQAMADMNCLVDPSGSH